MDRVVVERKLDSLRRCLQRVTERCPASAEALAEDLDAQDIVSLNLTRAVQLCVDLAAHLLTDLGGPPPESMGATFSNLARAGVLKEDVAMRLRRAVGFRNLAVHNYDEIDWRIVHTIATTHLNDFRVFARQIADALGLIDRGGAG